MKILESLKGFILNFFFREKLAELKKFGENLEKIEKDFEDFRATVLSVISAALVIMEEQMYHSEKNDDWRKVQELRRKIEQERK